MTTTTSSAAHAAFQSLAAAQARVKAANTEEARAALAVPTGPMAAEHNSGRFEREEAAAKALHELRSAQSALEAAQHRHALATEFGQRLDQFEVERTAALKADADFTAKAFTLSCDALAEALQVPAFRAKLGGPEVVLNTIPWPSRRALNVHPPELRWLRVAATRTGVVEALARILADGERAAALVRRQTPLPPNTNVLPKSFELRTTIRENFQRIRGRA